MFSLKVISVVISSFFAFVGICMAADYDELRNPDELRNFPYEPRHPAYQQDHKQKKDNNSVWLKAVGSKSDQDSIKGVSGYESTSIGFLGGYDRKISRTMRLGVGGGFIKSDVNSDTVGSKGDVKTYNMGVYSSYDHPDRRHPFYLDGVLLYNRGDIDNSRAGGITGDTYSNAFTLAAEYGYKGRITKNFTLNPVLKLSSSLVDVKGYTEKGTGALEIDYSLDRFLSTTLGFKSSYQAGFLTLGARALWEHEFSSDIRTTTKSRNAGSTDSFDITQGIDTGADRAILGTSVTIEGIGPASLTLGYDAKLGDEYLSHTGDLTFRYPF